MNEDTLYLLVARKLKASRQRQGLTQDDVALAVGVTRTSLTNIESGRQRPPLHTLYRICQVLSVEVAEVLPTHKEIERGPAMQLKIDGEDVELSPRVLRALRLAIAAEKDGEPV